MSLTKPQLQKQLALLKAENEALRNKRTIRLRFPSGVWPNNERRNERDPAWRATVRTVVPEGLEAGDTYYIDLSLWPYDPDTSPVKYKKNPPDMSVSLSPTDPAYALELEARREKAMAERGQV